MTFVQCVHWAVAEAMRLAGSERSVAGRDAMMLSLEMLEKDVSEEMLADMIVHCERAAECATTLDERDEWLSVTASLIASLADEIH